MKFTNIRIFFSKTNRAKYISHLDLYRAFGRSLKRSGLPLWITEGFNPHIYTTFALPLSLGIEGLCESVDLRLTESVEFDEIVNRLNAVMPEGLQILRAGFPVRNANDISLARYRVRGAGGDLAVLTALDAFFAQEQIEIVKKSKSKTQTMDVKPLLSWEAGGEERTLTLPAGNALSINPWNVLQGFEGLELARTEILCSDGAVFE